MDWYIEQQITGSEAIYVDMAVLQPHHEGGGSACMPSYCAHSPDSWSFVGGELAPLCVYCNLLLTVSHMLLQYPQYDKDHSTFHLQGTLCVILGNDHGNISNIMDFLHGTGV
jgi:hypothetical protein